MDMPTPCPRCGEVVEFEDMVNHPNEFKILVCEDCKDKIEEENNRGSDTDSFGNVVEWHSDPDHGLIEFKANGEEVTAWCCEDDPEVSFHSFMEIWNKAQELTGKEKLEAITAERDQLIAQVNALRTAALNAISFMSGGNEKAELRDAYDATPQQCLADIRAKAIRQFVSDTNETGQLSFPDCQWLEQWLDEWLDEAAKGGE